MEQTTANLMRRLVRSPAPPPSLTPARALRLAMVRAAERSINLHLAVLGVSEDSGPLDDLLSRLEDGLLMIALYEGAEPVGLIALDAEARAAAIEVQTFGKLLPSSPEAPAVTSADAALARPFLAAFLCEMQTAVEGTSRGGWTRNPRLTSRLPGAREAAMLLADGTYRVVRLTLDLGAGERQGLALAMIRLPGMTKSAADARPADATVAEQVMGAQAMLTAVLHRISLPLSEAEALEVGQVLALPGVTVASVRIEAGGVDLGPGRLGQVAGMRAVRMEQPLAPYLEEIPALGDQSSDPESEPPMIMGGMDWDS